MGGGLWEGRRRKIVKENVPSLPPILGEDKKVKGVGGLGLILCDLQSKIIFFLNINFSHRNLSAKSLLLSFGLTTEALFCILKTECTRIKNSSTLASHNTKNDSICPIFASKEHGEHSNKKFEHSPHSFVAKTRLHSAKNIITVCKSQTKDLHTFGGRWESMRLKGEKKYRRDLI